MNLPRLWDRVFSMSPPNSQRALPLLDAVTFVSNNILDAVAHLSLDPLGQLIKAISSRAAQVDELPASVRQSLSVPMP